jgi:ferredoxin
MSLRSFIKLVGNHRLSAFPGVNALFKPFYKLSYIAAAKECGLLDKLRAAPMEFDRIAEAYCKGAKAREALAAWLQMGVRLGYLKARPGGYELKGLAKGCFEFYNYAHLFDDLAQAKFRYQVFLKEEQRAAACVDCGTCEDLCPQKIPISEWMPKVSALLA